MTADVPPPVAAEAGEGTMRVLVIGETNDVIVDGAAAVLGDAGHEVLRCDDDAGHLCRGMPGGAGCPVEGGVDIAVTLGSPVAGSLVADGVRCAVRHFVPLVTVGETDGLSRAVDGAVPTLRAERSASLGEAVLAAADAPLPRHSELASAELRSVLASHGVSAPSAEAVVRRSAGELRVELRPCVEVEERVAQAAAVRVTAVLRSYDHASGAVGVVHDTSV